MNSRLFDSSILATSQQAVEFVSNILESSTEYSVIGKDLDGKILLWNEGARRMSPSSRVCNPSSLKSAATTAA